MTRPDHETWEELAAGFALHALEPDEETRFRDHLAGCARCRQVLDDHLLVAAQLGTLAVDGDEPAPTWSRIREQVVGPPPATVTPLPRRRRLARRALAAAAAVIALAGAAVAGWRLSGGSAGTHQPVLASVRACEVNVGCHVIRLQRAGHQAAVILVQDGSASMLPTAMSAPPQGKAYAVWQLPRDGRPVLVAEMRQVRPGTPTRLGSLTVPYPDTAAFAVSVEPADVIPSHPSQVVAVGSA